VDEAGGEEGNIEDMHCLLVNVEKLKRKMVNKVERLHEDPNLDYTAFNKLQENPHVLDQKDQQINIVKRSLDDPNLNVFIYE